MRLFWRTCPTQRVPHRFRPGWPYTPIENRKAPIGPMYLPGPVFHKPNSQKKAHRRNDVPLLPAWTSRANDPPTQDIPNKTDVTEWWPKQKNSCQARRA
jgi:hypothetical protein